MLFAAILTKLILGWLEFFLLQCAKNKGVPKFKFKHELIKDKKKLKKNE